MIETEQHVVYLCSLEGEIVTFGTYFDDFLETLPGKVIEKIDYIFLLLVFFCFDEGRLVILFNGFQKKTQNTPTKEIKKALRIMKEYYESKK